MKLTDLSIRKLKHPESGRKIYFDDNLPGFGIRLSKRSKSFVAYFGKSTNRQFKTIGKYPDLSLSDARREAKILLATQPKLNRSTTNYSDAVKSFLSDRETKNRPETVRQYRTYLEAFHPKKKLADITRSDILKHLDTYKNRNSAYSHSLVSLKVFYGWCIRNDLVEFSPIAGEQKPKVPPRERVLSSPELKEIFSYEDPNFSIILKLAMLTGQRRTELASVEPDWIEEDTITFPSWITKNKRTHTIPTTPRIHDLLTNAPFGKNGAFNGWSNGKRRIDKVVKIDHWTIHDLRRTFATIQAQIGTPIHITERLLNHSSGTISGVAAVYNRHTYMTEMRSAMHSFENHLFREFDNC